MQRLEVIANNLANAETTGFKRDLGIVQSRYAEAIQQGLSSAGSGSIDDLGGGVRFQETKTDFSDGALKRTDCPTEVAIRGDGFFLVRKGDANYLTRRAISPSPNGGELVTQQGYQCSATPIPVAISPDGGHWKVNDGGAIRRRAHTKPGLVKPASLGDLVKTGENLFRPLADPQAIPAQAGSVAPGYVELAGVQPTTELDRHAGNLPADRGQRRT